MIQRLLWLYLLLLLFEGALRKWICPGLSNVLLLARDPIVLFIYLLAFRQHLIPINGFILGAIIMALFAFMFSFFIENTTLTVTLYGIRSQFMYLPFLFIFPRVLTPHNLYKIERFICWISIGMTVLIIVQFFSHPFHWINYRVGGIISFGLAGGEGHFRPTGTFSCSTGIVHFYALALACLLCIIIHRSKIPHLLCFLSASAIVIAIPFSISRSLVLHCAVLLLVGAFSFFFIGKASKSMAKIFLIGSCVFITIQFLPFFDDGLRAFTQRWETSTGEHAGGFNKNILSRALTQLTDSFSLESPFLGHGIGKGTNVAARLLTGRRKFLLSETGWSCILLELGPLLGFTFIFYRVMLVFYLLRLSIRHLKAGNTAPLLLLFSCIFSILDGQWGNATIGGFAFFGGGLCLAAQNNQLMKNE